MRITVALCLFIVAIGPWSATAQADPFDRKQYGLTELAAGLFEASKLDRRTGCLAAALYFEARGESHAGRMAVAMVILNRVKARAYPSTLCGVVWQNAHRRNRCQFSFTCDGTADVPRNKPLWNRIVAEAKAVLCKRSCRPASESQPFAILPTSLRLATHYHADYVQPGWRKKLIEAAQVGRHIFYISERVTRSMPATT